MHVAISTKMCTEGRKKKWGLHLSAKPYKSSSSWICTTIAAWFCYCSLPLVSWQSVTYSLYCFTNLRLFVCVSHHNHSCHRHPESSGRPSFADLVSDLSQSEGELLVWSEQDRSCHPQAAMLGAPMEAGAPLYPLLQNSYMASD